MAMDDRDWYRDLLREKARYVERAHFRKSVNSRGSPGLRSAPRPWHPVLIVLLTASIFLAVFAVLKLISKFV